MGPDIVLAPGRLSLTHQAVPDAAETPPLRKQRSPDPSSLGLMCLALTRLLFCFVSAEVIAFRVEATYPRSGEKLYKCCKKLCVHQIRANALRVENLEDLSVNSTVGHNALLLNLAHWG